MKVGTKVVILGVHPRRGSPTDADPVVEGRVTGHMRNASQLPVKIARIAYRTETRWLVEDPEPRRPDGSPVAWTPTPGTEPHFAFQEDVRVPPQETIDAPFAVNVAHMAPDGATHLSLTDGIRVHVEWLLVVDNAGRRWQVHPEKGGRAKRVRRRWRPKENMPRDW